jgi:hypothetical protein
LSTRMSIRGRAARIVAAASRTEASDPRSSGTGSSDAYGSRPGSRREPPRSSPGRATPSRRARPCPRALSRPRARARRSPRSRRRPCASDPGCPPWTSPWSDRRSWTRHSSLTAGREGRPSLSQPPYGGANGRGRPSVGAHRRHRTAGRNPGRGLSRSVRRARPRARRWRPLARRSRR